MLNIDDLLQWGIGYALKLLCAKFEDHISSGFFIYIYRKHSFSDWRCSVNMMSLLKTPQNVLISVTSWARSIFDFAKSIFFIKINIFLFKFGLSLHNHMKVFSEVFTKQSKFSFFHVYIALSDALIVRIGIAKIESGAKGVYMGHFSISFQHF